jgi:hypothetical protein
LGDAMVHELLVRFINRKFINIHIACIGTKENKTPRFLKDISSIAETNILPINFGPDKRPRSLADAAFAAQILKKNCVRFDVDGFAANLASLISNRVDRACS